MKIETIDHREFDRLVGDADTPIIVKIDVEGFEKTVIDQLMKSRNFKRITEIFYEVDERWVDPVDLREALATNGFTRIRKIGSGKHYDVLASKSHTAHTR